MTLLLALCVCMFNLLTSEANRMTSILNTVVTMILENVHLAVSQEPKKKRKEKTKRKKIAWERWAFAFFLCVHPLADDGKKNTTDCSSWKKERIDKSVNPWPDNLYSGAFKFRFCQDIEFYFTFIEIFSSGLFHFFRLKWK